MVFVSSDLTLKELQNAANDASNLEVDDDTVARAARYGLSIYQRLERRFNPERSKRYTDNLAITSAGLLVSSIGIGNLTQWLTTTAYVVGDRVQEAGLGYVCLGAHDSNLFQTDLTNKKWVLQSPLMSDTEGFEVYYRGSDNSTTNKDQNLRIPRVRSGDRFKRGYEIRGDGRLYIVPEITISAFVYIEYIEKPITFSTTKVSMTQSVPIERDMEAAFEEFVLSRLYGRQGLPALQQEAEAKFIEKLVQFFQPAPRAIIY